MSSKKESLSEKFADLIIPTPFLQQDDDFVQEESTARVIDAFDAESENETDTVELSTLRLKNADVLGLVDGRYAGEPISRKTLQDSSEEFSDDSEATLPTALPDDKTYTEHETDEEAQSHEEDMEQSDEVDQESEYCEEEDEEGSMFPNEGEADANNAFQHFSSLDAGAEVAKGNAVRNQLSLWDGIFELRIQLQKCLLSANQLPLSENADAFLLQGGNDYKTVQHQCSKKVSKLLESLINLQSELLKRNPETKAILTGAKLPKQVAESDEEVTSTDDNVDTNEEEPQQKQRRMEDFSSVLNVRHNSFISFRNSTIQKWNDKTRVAQGRINSKNFTSFEQSTVKQIENVLADKQRLLKRTRHKRSAYHILGQPEKTESNKADQDSNFEDYSTEIFNDDDFYHQMLRELIEHKCEGVTDPIQLGRKWIALQKIRSKMKRKIDTRATKGRKIRYAVHSKLVNFMAPYDKCVWTEESKSELFRSLFAA